MTPAQLSALRRLLHYSAPEAARWVAADAERPKGVEDRTWNRWESGTRPVPPNIAAAVLQLVAWRGQHLDALRALPAPVVLPWHDDADDWPGPGALRRPAQSAAAQLLAELGPDRVRLVTFDARAFAGWRAAGHGQGLALDAAHAAWAAQAAQAAPLNPEAEATS